MSASRERTRRPGACACGAPLEAAAGQCTKCGVSSKAPRMQTASADAQVPPALEAGPRFGQDFARMSVRAGPAAPRYLEVGDPVQDAVPLEGSGKKAEAGKDSPKPAAPSCGETLNWDPQSPVPADITANNLPDFAAKITQALGGNPHMSAQASWDSETDGKVVTKVNLTLKTTIIRPRLAGGRASATDKKVMERCVEVIKAHENEHRDASRAVWQQAVCDALGKPVAAASKVLETARCSGEPSAQAAIDAVNGEIQWISDTTGNTVDFKTVGVKQNYKPSDCK